ncbi:helix-turn-helix domain-containing protein [Pseudoalteromonas luteoviolacea]|uniref:HTH araC/xylS-type domain-containing protein n=1 Tax=Pseudoalteromonas luteoviolacea S4060-1 TaxID=1365257 RepID=A0A162AL38_9GAMM|nr:AraC family transcriptional regulator [Pseudoalteromonas luteoviolacea]KZN61328.1 hypothetical protein N478_04490 [Pseudoalteromonas luteoviolacea S4060-1]
MTIKGLGNSEQKNTVESKCNLKHHEEVFITAHIFMQENIEKKLSLSLVCKQLGVNKNKLVEAFKKSTGLTPFQWLRIHRLKTAKQMLENSPLSISSIALNLGYCDANNFSTAFRKWYGFSPKEFRENSGETKKAS